MNQPKFLPQKKDEHSPEPDAKYPSLVTTGATSPHSPKRYTHLSRPARLVLLLSKATNTPIYCVGSVPRSISAHPSLQNVMIPMTAEVVNIRVSDIAIPYR